MSRTRCSAGTSGLCTPSSRSVWFERSPLKRSPWRICRGAGRDTPSVSRILSVVLVCSLIRVLGHTAKAASFKSLGYSWRCFQSVPRDGGYCNVAITETLVAACAVSIRPEGRGVLQRSKKPAACRPVCVSIRPEGRGVLQPRASPTPRIRRRLNPSRGTGGTATRRQSSAVCRRRCLNPSRGTGGTATADGRQDHQAPSRLNPSRGTGGTATGTMEGC